VAQAYGRLPAKWRYETALTGYFRQDNLHSGPLSNAPELADYWRQMKRRASAGEFRLLALYAPLALEVMQPSQLNYMPVHLNHRLIGPLNSEQPFQVMEGAARAADVPILDPRKILRIAAGHGQQVYSAKYWHWTKAGHRTVAAFVLTQLADRGLVGSKCLVPGDPKEMSAGQAPELPN
jgi:hypothetical protein